jgi:hypothetical protein
MTDGTGRWTARRRLIRVAPNVKTTLSLCPRAGRWQPTMPIHYTSSDRTAGEQLLWLLQVDVHTILPILQVVPGLCPPLQACLRPDQRIKPVPAII